MMTMTKTMLCSTSWRRSGDPHVTDCHNLRPVSGSGGTVLEVAGRPRVLADATHIPLAADGNTLLVGRGRDLLWIDTASANPLPELICTLPSEPRCVLTGTETWLVMTAQGPFRLDRGADGRLTASGLMPRFPAVTVTAEECGTFNTVVSAGDTADAGRKCVAAYTALADDAAAAGTMIQPVMARCRLLDSAGNTIHTLPETLVSIPGGGQLTAPIELTATGGGTATEALALTVRAYRLRVSVADTCQAPWSDIVARMAVEVSPQFHPIDPSDEARTDSDGQTKVRVSLPGRERGLSPTRPAMSEELIKRCAERFDRLAVTAGVIYHPFRNAATGTFNVPSRGGVAHEAALMHDRLAESVTATDSLTARMAVPNTFTADTVATDNGCTLWGNARPVRFGGHNPGCFAAKTGGRRWTGRVKVEFADGACTVSDAEGSDNPVTLSPLLSYPAPDAVRMTLTVKADGESSPRGITVKLTPDTSGRRSVYVSPGLQPIALTENPDETDDGDASEGKPFGAGFVAATPARYPRAVESVTRVAADIKSMLPARRDRYRSDFGRPEFYAFGPDGIRLAGLSASRELFSVSVIDTHGIDSPRRVADTGDGIAVLSAGNLFRLTRSGLTLLAADVPGDRVAWISGDREIVTADSDDNEARHYSADNDCRTWYTTDMAVASEGWLSTPAGAYAVTDEGLTDPGCRFRSDLTNVRWQASVTPAGGLRTLPAAVTWMIKGRAVGGNLSALREWLNAAHPAAATVSRLTVDGEVRSPLSHTLSGHRLIDLQLKAALTVSPDFSITFPLIHNNDDSR